MDQPLLKLSHVTVCYNGLPAVRDISFDLMPGEVLGLVGESGSGKSTVIRSVTGLLGEAGRVTRGDICFKGKNVIDMSDKARRHLLGPEIGMVFQDCEAALCPIRKVGAQIHESLSAHKKITRKASDRLAAEMMTKIGLRDPERILSGYPFEMSGGMNQRIGIVMAMLMQPALLLADEPTSALDVTVQAQVVQLLRQMRENDHTAMILVTHNMGLVEALCDRVLVMKDGEMVETGPVKSLLAHPASPYTRQLMDAVLRLAR